jgi:hypothetical protein
MMELALSHDIRWRSINFQAVADWMSISIRQVGVDSPVSSRLIEPFQPDGGSGALAITVLYGDAPGRRGVGQE